MKKFIFTTLIAVASVVAMASNILEDVKVNYAVRQAFAQEFGNVKNVTWQKASNNMLRADFLVDEEKVSAFFSEDGNHVATTVQKDLQTLPGKLRAAIKEKFNNKEPKELFELISDEEHAYFFAMEEKGKTTVYKAFGSGTIRPFEIAKN